MGILVFVLVLCALGAAHFDHIGFAFALAYCVILVLVAAFLRGANQ
ncbi:hypothetical protein [Paraglaciecola agarilytica]|nr:hypothetical protein [Paraglaciecola agarilytica]